MALKGLAFTCNATICASDTHVRDTHATSVLRVWNQAFSFELVGENVTCANNFKISCLIQYLFLDLQNKGNFGSKKVNSLLQWSLISDLAMNVNYKWSS